MVYRYILIFILSTSFSYSQDFGVCHLINGATSDNDNEGFALDLKYMEYMCAKTPDVRTYLGLENTKTNNAKDFFDKTPNSNQNQLVYLTDHGVLSKDNKASVHISGYQYSAGETSDALKKLRSNKNPDSNVIVIHDYCYSGGMLEGIFEDPDDPKNLNINPHICGLSSASANEVAYIDESYSQVVGKQIIDSPENLDLDKNKEISLFETYDYYERSYKTTSTPYLASDLFLERYFQNQYILDSSQLDTNKEHLISSLQNTKSCNIKVHETKIEEIDSQNTTLRNQILNQYANRLINKLTTSYSKFSWSKDGLSAKELVDKRAFFHKELMDLKDKVYEAEKAEIAFLEPAEEKLKLEDMESELINQTISLSLGLYPYGLQLDNTEEIQKYSQNHPEDANLINLLNQVYQVQDLQKKHAQEKAKYDEDIEMRKLNPKYIELEEKTISLKTKYRTKKQEIGGVNRLYKNVTAASSIKHMIERGDERHLNDLLDLLTCEASTVYSY